MKLRIPLTLLAMLACATASAKTYVAQVINIVNEGKTSDCTTLLKFSNNNGVWDGSTNESPRAWVKDGLGTGTITGDLTVYQPIIVREGTLLIQDCTIKTYNNLTDGVSNLLIGGNAAHLVLDGATYKQDLDYNQHYVSAIAIGTGDGAGTVTLQNGSLLHTDHFIFAGYTSISDGYVGNTTVSWEDYSDYTGGIAGRSTINILEGSTLSAGTCLQFANVDVNIDGSGSQLIDLNRDSSKAPAATSYLGNDDNSQTIINITNGGALNIQQSLLTGWGENSTIIINADGEGSAFNAKGGVYLGAYEKGSESILNLTNGATANFESFVSLGGGDTASTNIDAASSVTADTVYAYQKATIENAGSINAAAYVIGGATINNSGSLTGGDMGIYSGSVNSKGSITLSGELSMQGGTLSLDISSANLQQATVNVGSFDGQSGNIVLRATENLKAGKYLIINVTESEDSGEEPGEEPGDVPAQVAATQSGVQYTLIGVDGLEPTWEDGDLFLTLNEQLIVARDPFSDAMMAANWGVFHSSQAFTGTLWAPRAAASCTEVEGKHTAWATAYSSFISQNGTGNFQGADYSIYGASMGVETPLGKNRLIGAAFGYDIGKASLPNSSDVDQTSCHIAAYGRAAVWCFGEQGNLAIDWSAAYGRTTSEHTAVAGDWTQDSFQLDARATYSRSLSTRTAVSAFFGAQYYSQDDASTARSQADAIKNFRLMLGTGIQQAVTDRTTVFGEATLRHDVVRDNPNVMVDGFRYGTGANPGRFGGSISAGVEHQLNDDWKVRANYSFEVSDEQNEHSFGAGASYSF